MTACALAQIIANGSVVALVKASLDEEPAADQKLRTHGRGRESRA
jgi:hypothetical protein